jgi:hypothetical protein
MSTTTFSFPTETARARRIRSLVKQMISEGSTDLVPSQVAIRDTASSEANDLVREDRVTNEMLVMVEQGLLRIEFALVHDGTELARFKDVEMNRGEFQAELPLGETFEVPGTDQTITASVENIVIHFVASTRLLTSLAAFSDYLAVSQTLA